MVPITKLPLLVLAEIIHVLDFQELVSFSLCSQKSNSFVRIFRPKKSLSNWKLSMINGKWPRAIIYNNIDFLKQAQVLGAKKLSELPNTEKNEIAISGHTVPIAFFPNGQLGLCLDTFWEDPVFGLKVVIDYVSSLFGLDVAKVSVEKNSVWALDWVKNRQASPVEMGWFECYASYTEEEFAFVMRNCRPTTSFQISATAPDTFRFHDPLPAVDELFINPGHWVTLENLLTVDSIEVIVWKSRVSNADVNAFLKHWISGGCTRLQYLNIEVENLNMVEILGNGLVVDVDPEDRTYQKKPFGVKARFVGGYSIQREDGTKATISSILARKSFFMVVWPVQ